jgi:hypothetical protein
MVLGEDRKKEKEEWRPLSNSLSVSPYKEPPQHILKMKRPPFIEATYKRFVTNYIMVSQSIGHNLLLGGGCWITEFLDIVHNQVF